MRFDGKTLRGAFEHQYVQGELSAWAHNKHVVQILYESIEDLGADPTSFGLSRP